MSCASIATIVERKVVPTRPFTPSSTTKHSPDPLSFQPPACTLTGPTAYSWHSPVHGATDPVPVRYPLEADSAERSETIKSTAESTLPCKLAHCQAQRFTVVHSIYIFYAYVFTHYDCHIVHYLSRHIVAAMVYAYIYCFSPYVHVCAYVCTGTCTVKTSHVRAGTTCVHLLTFSHPPRTHARTS